MSKERYNFFIRKDGSTYSNRFVNWDIILPRSIGNRYNVKPSAYIELNTFAVQTALIEVVINFKAKTLSLDTDTTNVTQSLGFARLIHSDTTNSVYTYVLETVDGNDLTCSHPDALIDISFEYFSTGATIADSAIINYTICLELTQKF